MVTNSNTFSDTKDVIRRKNRTKKLLHAADFAAGLPRIPEHEFH